MSADLREFGISLLCRRNLNPIRCKRDRMAISIGVSLERVARMRLSTDGEEALGRIIVFRHGVRR